MECNHKSHADIQITRATLKDLDALEGLMNFAQAEAQATGYFCADDRAYLTCHIQDSQTGFLLKATCANTLVGFFIVHYPHLSKKNMAYDCFPESVTPALLEQVAHFDSAVVSPDYRGCHIMSMLMRAAMKELDSTDYCYYMATVHPDNHNSLKNLLQLHFQIVKTTVKYGGLPRHIMMYKRNG